MFAPYWDLTSVDSGSIMGVVEWSEIEVFANGLGSPLQERAERG